MSEPEAEQSVIQQAVDEVRRNNKWATRIEVALIALMVTAVVTSTILTAVNTSRLTALAEQGNKEREAITQLAEIIQKYNEDHAVQAENSFRVLHESQRCAVLKLFTGTAFEKITPEEIAACYQPLQPAPPPPPTPPPTTRR